MKHAIPLCFPPILLRLPIRPGDVPPATQQRRAPPTTSTFCFRWRSFITVLAPRTLISWSGMPQPNILTGRAARQRANLAL